MKEILDRLAKFDMFEIVVFADEVILHYPVEEWPICDALISFFSKGTLPVYEWFLSQLHDVLLSGFVQVYDYSLKSA